MVETGIRAGEAVALTVDDLDLRAGTALVRRGKGGKGRLVPFGPQTGRALDRYLRLRRTHRLAATPALWLGARNKTLGYSGLHQALGIRAAQAGIQGFHPHVLRHTAAHRWLAAGASRAGSWPWPVGRAATCSTATPPRPPPSGPQTRLAGSGSATYRASGIPAGRRTPAP